MVLCLICIWLWQGGRATIKRHSNLKYEPILLIFDNWYKWSLNFLMLKYFLNRGKIVPLIGIRPLILAFGLITVVGQYPEIPSQNTVHFKQAKIRLYNYLFVHFIIWLERIHCIFCFNMKFVMTFIIFMQYLDRKCACKNLKISLKLNGFQRNPIHISFG